MHSNINHVANEMLEALEYALPLVKAMNVPAVQEKCELAIKNAKEVLYEKLS